MNRTAANVATTERTDRCRSGRRRFLLRTFLSLRKPDARKVQKLDDDDRAIRRLPVREPHDG